MEYDVIVCGSGIAGIYAALNLDPSLRVAIISNDKPKSCNTYLAQGGITTVRGKEDKESFIADTLYAGGHENNLETVSLIADESERNINKLVEMGVPFNRDEKGELLYTREAAHSKRRILFSNDQTGKHIFLTLVAEMGKRENITVYSELEVFDLLKTDKKEVYGVIASNSDNEILQLRGRKIILATGGIGGLFKNSTNRRNLKGVGVALVKKHGGTLSSLGYIQFHPTAFYDPESERRFLISESLRGEGAKLKDLEGNRFVDELLPRDVVAKHIEDKKKELDSEYVYLDASELDEEFLKVRFKGIYNNLMKKGLNLAKDLIPVTTSQHYFMGGVKVDMDGETDLKNLFACGEIACTGLHGRNRLASNSLLEGLIFGNRVAEKINKEIKLESNKAIENIKNNINLSNYRKLNLKELGKIDILEEKLRNKQLVIDEILKVRGDLKDELSIN